jgi:hypothetical protein
MKLNLDLNLKHFELLGLGLNCLLALGLTQLPDVMYVNPNKIIEPVVKNGEAYNRLRTTTGNPYPSLPSTAGAILLISGSLLIIKSFGTTTVIELGQDIQNIFTKQQAEAINLIKKIPIPHALPLSNPMDSAIAPDDLLMKFIKYPNCAVIGKPGTGKTTTLQTILARYIEAFPDATITILDKNAGKEGNDWLGLMMGDADDNKIVFRSPDDIYRVIKDLHQKLEERATIAEDLARVGRRVPKFPPILCIFDEFPTTSLSLIPEDKANGKYPGYMSMIKQILLEGRGYNIKFIIGMQSPDSGTGGLPQVFISGLSKLWLVHEQLSNKEVKGYFPLDDSDQDTAVLTRLNELKRTGRRCMLLNLEGEKHAFLTPDFSNPPRIRESSELWFEQLLQEHGERLHQEIISYVNGDRASPLKEFCRSIKLEQRTDDPKYSEYLKPWFESQVNQLKQSIN